MNLFDYGFTFGKRETSTDITSKTKCKLNRYVQSPYLIGYNLTIGVQEYYNSGKYWRGVNWCYAEPIVSTLAYWQSTIKSKFEFMEVITMTNGPDPYNSPEYWVPPETPTSIVDSIVGLIVFTLVAAFFIFKMSKSNGPFNAVDVSSKAVAVQQTAALFTSGVSLMVAIGLVLTVIGIPVFITFILTPIVVMIALSCFKLSR
jgi:hypothetical protein